MHMPTFFLEAGNFNFISLLLNLLLTMDFRAITSQIVVASSSLIVVPVLRAGDYSAIYATNKEINHAYMSYL